MAYSKGNLKSSDFKASLYFRPFRIGKLSEKCLPIRTSYTFHLKNILKSLTGFMGTPDFMRILHNTSLLTKS
jgi:hypothetical protein